LEAAREDTKESQLLLAPYLAIVINY